jgi:hypothetical protein
MGVDSTSTLNRLAGITKVETPHTNDTPSSVIGGYVLKKRIKVTMEFHGESQSCGILREPDGRPAGCEDRDESA